jgi:hypothetical protein
VGKNYALAGAIGLILGFGMVWWVRPDTSPGAVFLVIASMLLCFIAGSTVHFFSSSMKPRSTPRRPSSTDRRKVKKP